MLRSPGSRPTRERLGQAICSSRSTPESSTWTMLGGEELRRSSRKIRRPRWRTSHASCARRAMRRSWPWSARPARPPPRTSWERSPLRTRPTIWADKSLNNEIGLPLTVCRLEPDTRVLITEMGMRGLGQIAALSAIARPDIAVVSHIGPEHLELLGTVERVAEANAEAIEALPAGGTAVVPANSAELEPFLSRRRHRAPPLRSRRCRARERSLALSSRRRSRRARAPVHAASSRRQHAGRAPCLFGARAPARPRVRRRVEHPALPVARTGARASGRRVRRQRRLQRQPRLDAGGARASRRAGGSTAAHRGARRDGGARRSSPSATTARSASSPEISRSRSSPSAKPRGSTARPCGPPTPPALSKLSAPFSSLGTPCWSRLRGRSGSKASPQRSRRSRGAWSQS